jgi:hypothetical protein
MKRWKFIGADGKPTGRTMGGCSRAFAEANALAGETIVEIAPSEHEVTPPDVLAKRRILGVEALAGPRAVREALLAVLPAGPERDRLKAHDDLIAKLRADVQANTVANVALGQVVGSGKAEPVGPPAVGK